VNKALFKKNGLVKKTGFTLIELIVVIGIFTIITTTAIVKQYKFKGDTLIRNLAYELALAVREAQVYGINVRAVKVGPEYRFDYAYGINFSMTTPQEYKIFVDSNANGDGTFGDGKYGVGDTLVQTYRLQGLNKIQSICRDDCGSGKNMQVLDLVFKRPDPDAKISGTGILDPNNMPQNVTIKLVSPQGVVKSVIVYKAGQISVKE
jgi:prepilin-type N-terminal cleavage/methylation domain-containing protein